MLCPEQLVDGRTRLCVYEDCKNCGIKTLEDNFFKPLASLTGANVTFRSVEKDASGRLGVQVKANRPPEEFINHIKS